MDKRGLLDKQKDDISSEEVISALQELSSECMNNNEENNNENG